MGKRNSYTWERIDFSTIQHELLKAISKDLRISLGGAVEYSLDRGLVPFYSTLVFFNERIEASPDSRVSHEELWSVFQPWFNSYGLNWHIDAHDFAVMGHEICYYKKIAVRVRGNQAFCLDVRLRA